MVQKSDIKSQLHGFLSHMEHDMGRSTKTIENYNRYLKRFIFFTKIHDPKDITETLVHRYDMWLGCKRSPASSGTLKQNTKNYHLTALRVFLKYLKEKGIITFEPKKIKLSKSVGNARIVPTEKDIERLISEPTGKTIKDIRDKAMVLIIVSTGMRISELCALNIVDIDFLRSEVCIKGVHGKKRVVPIFHETKKVLQEYLGSRVDKDTALFVNNGKYTTKEGSIRLTPRSVQRIISRFGTKVGTTKKVTPQSLRHAYAAYLLREGKNLSSMQTLLGHKHSTTTRSYTRLL